MSLGRFMFQVMVVIAVGVLSVFFVVFLTCQEMFKERTVKHE